MTRPLPHLPLYHQNGSLTGHSLWRTTRPRMARSTLHGNGLARLLGNVLARLHCNVPANVPVKAWVRSLSVFLVFVATLCGELAGLRAADESGLRQRQGRHIRLVTDLQESPQLDDWVAAFDAAVPLWSTFWAQDPDRLADWRVTAYVMTNKGDFADRGLIPAELPDFRFGYQSGNRLWVLHQPTIEYTRHLLLHEGAHGVSARLFGGGGPPWYSEGVAEFLSTNAWRSAAAGATPNMDGGGEPLRIGIIPTDPMSVAGWGRIELIAQARRENRIPRIESVMRYGETAHRDVEPYAWSWLAVTLMEMYPEYREAFHDAAKRGGDASPQFNSKLYADLRTVWPTLALRWWLLALDIDYGYDTARGAVAFPGKPIPIGKGPEKGSVPFSVDSTVPFSVDSTRGWQPAPFALRAGQTVSVTAQGRYTLRRPSDARAWESEADGVTIRYHRGKPLGQLVACLLPLRITDAAPNLPANPVQGIGSSGTITATSDSWLFLRVNEATGELGDNAGELSLTFGLAE